jgi:transposase
LPKYSPNFNSIEHEWDNLKVFWRDYGRYADTLILVPLFFTILNVRDYITRNLWLMFY